MKKRRNKKGFTLVELLVVIGIIAVLAVVSVVGYFGFIKKANLSNDQSSITQMNLGLQADAVDKKDGKYTYAGDAVQALYSQGWNKGKMEPYSSNYKYAYSIENNKMYLLDESDNVVFPETKDSTFKSTLWGFYCNGDSNGIKGISNYVALDNIDDFACFNNFLTNIEISNNELKLDLNSWSIRFDDQTYSNVSILNGYLISGTFKNESTYSTDNITKYKEINTSNITTEGTVDNPTKVEEAIIKDFQTSKDGDKWKESETFKVNNLLFKDCVFYNPSKVANDVNITFENCTFIGGTSGTKFAVYVSSSSGTNFTAIFKNCTFKNTIRGINTQMRGGNVEIENCTFDGVQEKFAALQISSTSSNSIKFINNTIKNVNKNAQCIVRFHDDYIKYSNDANLSLLDKVTFSGNKVDNSIEESKYVDLDDFENGSKDSYVIDKITYSNSDGKYSSFYNAALAKFKAGLVS